jgi:hypothetical protein
MYSVIGSARRFSDVLQRLAEGPARRSRDAPISADLALRRGRVRLGGLIAYAVDEDLEQGSSVGGRLVGPDPRGDDSEEGAIDTH